MREETSTERQARTLKENVGALKLVAEQALERGDKGEEFTPINRIDLFTAIRAGEDALRIIRHMEKSLKENACTICGRPGAALQGVEHDGWCWGCVRNRIEGKGVNSYGKPFPDYPRPWAEEVV